MANHTASSGTEKLFHGANSFRVILNSLAKNDDAGVWGSYVEFAIRPIPGLPSWPMPPGELGCISLNDR